jgi:hypothetical protein
MKVQHIAQPKQTPWGYQVDVTYVNDIGLAYTQACCYRDKKPGQKAIDADVAVVLAKLTDEETKQIDAIVEVKIAPVRAELVAVTADRAKIATEKETLVAEKADLEAQLAEAIAVKEEPIIPAKVVK